MRLSIITINYNHFDGLRKTADSVVSQTFTDYEWIVVDGGSTDGSKELIERYADNISWWCSEPDKGIYNAMNKGIIKAHGEYCFFLNSGDYLVDAGALQRAFDCQFSEDVVWGYPISQIGADIPDAVKPRVISLMKFINETIPHTGAVFFKRYLFEESEYGLYDENLKIVSDWKWYLQALGLGRASGKFIDINLSVTESGGISETNRKLLGEERTKVLSEVVPERILIDCMELNELRYTLKSSKRLSNISLKLLAKAILYKFLRPFMEKNTAVLKIRCK